MRTHPIYANAGLLFILAFEPGAFAGPLRFNIVKRTGPIEARAAFDADAARDAQSSRHSTRRSSRRKNEDGAAAVGSGIQRILNRPAVVGGSVTDDVVGSGIDVLLVQRLSMQARDRERQAHHKQHARRKDIGAGKLYLERRGNGETGRGIMMGD